MTSETNLRFCYFLLTEGVEVSLSVYWCIARHQTAQYSSLDQYKGRLPFVYINQGFELLDITHSEELTSTSAYENDRSSVGPLQFGEV